MAPREQIIETARKWVQAHDSGPDRDASIMALTAPDFVAHHAPRSLETPDFNREEYVEFQSQAFAVFESYSHKEVDFVIDEAQNKVVYYLDVEAHGAGGNVKYESQYIQKLLLTDDGKLVREFHTFLDSQNFVTFMNRVQGRH